MLIENSFEFEGLLCYPKPSANLSYYFVPLEADLDRGPNDRPLINLIAVGTSGYLLFTAVWRAPEQSVEALRQEVAKRNEIADPSTIQLALPPVQVAGCELLIGDGSGELQALAHSSTSGLPPYSVLFNLLLNEEQFASASAALNGNPGRLAVEYDVLLITPVSAAARLVPLSSEFVAWLQEYLDSGPAGFRAAIEEAIEEGLAAIQLDLTQHPSEELITRLYDRVLTRATEVLPRLIQDWGIDMTTDLEVAVSLVESVRQALHPRVDIGVIELPEPPIHVAPGGMEASTGRGAAQMERMGPPLRVSVGFDPGEAPLAWVRLQREGAEILLKPPQFGPASLPAGRVYQPLRLTAGFTNGAPAYKATLMIAGEAEITLGPEDVGLTMLVIDGRPLVEAGARSAQVWLRYFAPHLRTEQRYSLRFGDDTWAAHLWLVTPTKASLRYLDYRWQAVGADGGLISESATSRGSSEIVLSYSGETTHVTN
jgi:hypothetical protein